ncbi:CD3324 family protein [Ruminococcus sp. 5_1_39BFAA]|uniref:CD3324 family protein n=1 Tax=Ruminococcus sp. 5_1_39BFAA TaxID=457412 RepID=UPI003568E173
MGYLRAEEVLPKEVLALIQQYVDGQTIYIPRKEGCQRSWGSGTDTKKDLECRNEQIYTAYQSGDTVKELAESYCLTEKSIQRIIRTYRK